MIRDVMQSAGLELFAEVGLILFFVGFLLVVGRALLMSRSAAERASQIPLDDDGEHGVKR